MKPDKRRLNVLIPMPLYKAVQQAARDEYITFTAMLIRILSAWRKEQEEGGQS